MSEVTRILDSIQNGDQASGELLPLVYDELRKLAAAKLAREKPGQTLDATALVIDGLTQAEQLFLDQVDPDGNPLAVTPVILLVPNAIYALAGQLMNATEIREDGNASKSKYPTNNPHAGKFRVHRSSYLSNAKYTGNSTKAWFLLADPNDLPVIEVAFLNGQERPTVESADADFNVLGIQMRGYHDFGVAKQDFRGGVKLKGEA